MRCPTCAIDHPPVARFCMRCARALPPSPPPNEPGWEQWSAKSRYYDPGLLSWVGQEEGWYVELSPSMANRYFGGDESVTEPTLIRVMTQLRWELIQTINTGEDERLLFFRRRIVNHA